MHKPNTTLAPTAPPLAPQPETPWHRQVSDLLQRAAALCADQGVDVDAFMKGAWTAYMEARPGLREHLEEMQLLNQLDELRKLDRIPKA